MSKLVQQSTEELRKRILEAIGKAVANGELPEEPIPDFAIEVPADRAHGDWATNAAMAVSYTHLPLSVSISSLRGISYKTISCKKQSIFGIALPLS